MHFSAKRGLAIACRPSIRLSLRPSDTDNTQKLRSLQPKGDPPTPRGTWGTFGEARGGVGKKWRAGEQKRQYL